MALSSFVYISNVTNLSDARYAAGMGVDLLGFTLDPKNESSLNKQQFAEISEWISGVNIVGEFGDSNPIEVKTLIGDFSLDYLLVSMESDLHAFSMLGIPLIFKIVVSKDNIEGLESTFNYCAGTIDYFLLESDYHELDKSDKRLLKTYASKYPLILGYGIDINNVSAIIHELNLKGICLKGSPELRPGYKNFDEMADILEALEIDN